MHIKRETHPISVSLPDGTQLTRSDLPSPQTRRWVASRKAKIVLAVTVGLISREEALSLYGLSDEEYEHWVVAVKNHGKNALKTTRLQKYRQL